MRQVRQEAKNAKEFVMYLFMFCDE